MQRLVFVLLMIAMPNLLFGQEAVLRSGEHDGFTRLAAKLPAISTWTLEQTGSSVRVRFTSRPPEFDLSQVYDRIGRSRINAVTKTKNTLEIELGCDCGVSTKASTPLMLVIDVVDAPLQDTTLKNRVDHTGLKFVSGNGLSLSQEASFARTDLRLRALQPVHSFDQPNTSDQIRKAEELLIRQLGRAMTSGLIEKVDPLDNHDSHAQGSVAVQKNTGALPLDVHLGYEATPGEIENGVHPEGVTCISDHSLDISKWAVGSGFFQGLMELRQELGAETHKVDSAGVLALARHYLHFGFGQEAAALLSSIEKTDDAALLLVLSKLIDPSDNAAPGELAKQVVCPGSVSMWAVLDGGVPGKNDQFDPMNAVRIFADLPQHLQRQLGSQLANSLQRLGFENAAQLILRILQRQEEPLSAEAIFATAQTSSVEENEKQITRLLKQAVATDTPISPQALIELVMGELQAEKNISFETIDLLASYVHQYRNDDISDRLQHVLLLANTRAGKFEDAWGLVVPIENHESRARDFMSDLVSRGTDFDMLNYGTKMRGFARFLPRAIRQRAAERLVQMGFHDLAGNYEDPHATVEARFNPDTLVRGSDSSPSAKQSDIESSVPADTEVSLYTGHAIVSQSRETRARIAALLSNTGVTN